MIVNSSPGTARQKVAMAAHILVAFDDSFAERLERACNVLLELQPSEFPPHLEMAI